MRMAMRMSMVQRVAVPQTIAYRAKGNPFAFASPYSVTQGEMVSHCLLNPEATHLVRRFSSQPWKV
jgi:hypothetical protein